MEDPWKMKLPKARRIFACVLAHFCIIGLTGCYNEMNVGGYKEFRIGKMSEGIYVIYNRNDKLMSDVVEGDIKEWATMKHGIYGYKTSYCYYNEYCTK